VTIRTNLATRPFYNERFVRVWLLAATALVLAATAFNASRILRYSRSDTRLATQAAQDEARASDLRTAATRLRASVDPKRIELVSNDARQANELIDRRTFSWTEVLNQFEATLPDNVRITAVRPKLDPKRGMLLMVNVVARGVDDVDELMANLEQTGAFNELITPEEHINEQGLLEAAIETRYQMSAAARGETPRDGSGGTKR
jgi:Tfp pilus assembly protein PilN